jgi:hypothetical protein
VSWKWPFKESIHFGGQWYSAYLSVGVTTQTREVDQAYWILERVASMQLESHTTGSCVVRQVTHTENDIEHIQFSEMTNLFAQTKESPPKRRRQKMN